MKLSIIVPVYNVEKYLDQCLNSLASQTLDDYEVIVVNDGTKDNSQDIIDKYVSKYPNFKGLIKKNGGLSDARNFGIPYATGEYITFLDSDDYVETDLYKRMYNLAKKEDSDLVVADLEYFFESGEKESYTNAGLNRVSDSDLKSAFLSPLFSWNKMYRRELFEKLNCKYPVGLWYEDIPVTLKFFSEIKKISYCEGTAYHYRQRVGSILASGFDKRMYDIFTIFEGVIKDFKERGKYETYKEELEYLFVEHFLVYGAFRFLRTEEYKDLMNKAFKFVKEYFPKNKNNKYIKSLGLKNNVFFYTNNKFTMHFWHWYLTRG